MMTMMSSLPESRSVMTLSLLTRHRRYGKCKCGGGSHCLPPRAIGLERLAQGRTYELISVLYTRLSSTSIYNVIYVTCPNSYAVWCIVANLCTTVRLQPNAESPRARAQTRLLDGPFSRLLRHAGSQ